MFSQLYNCASQECDEFLQEFWHLKQHFQDTVDDDDEWNNTQCKQKTVSVKLESYESDEEIFTANVLFKDSSVHLLSPRLNGTTNPTQWNSYDDDDEESM